MGEEVAHRLPPCQLDGGSGTQAPRFQALEEGFPVWICGLGGPLSLAPGHSPTPISRAAGKSPGLGSRLRAVLSFPGESASKGLQRGPHVILSPFLHQQFCEDGSMTLLPKTKLRLRRWTHFPQDS